MAPRLVTETELDEIIGAHLLNRFGPTLVRLAGTWSGGDDVIRNDIVVEIMLRAVAHLQRGRPVNVAWLTRAARFAAADLHRFRSNRGGVGASTDYSETLARHRTCADFEREHVNERSGELDAVTDALVQLADEDRSILVDRYLHDETEAEIARRLGISQATVSRRIESALAAAREQFADLEDLLVDHLRQPARRMAPRPRDGGDPETSS